MLRFYILSISFVVFGSLNSIGTCDESLRVMSFNIRFGTANDGPNHWKTRDQLVLKTIKDFQPDLLGTQETLKFQAEFLAKNLENFTAVGRSREKDPDRGEQCTIFYRTDRFELKEQGQFWLSETPDKIASKSWDSSLPRIATWIRLQDKKTKRTIYFLNTHFDHIGKTARLESAKLIARKIVGFNAPTVVAGDFNCGENSKPYRALVKTKTLHLRDAFRAVNKEPSQGEGTFNGFRGRGNGARIDWVLVTDQWIVQKAAINRFNQAGKYPSDHFPVTATLQLK